MSRRLNHDRYEDDRSGDQRGSADSSRVDHSKTDDSLFDDLSRPLPSPDLTRSIMGRLGYMKVSHVIARKRRMQRWAGRVSVTLVMFMSLGLALKLYENSPEIRRPTGPTLPAAIGNDLQRQQRRLGVTIDTIRNLSPRPPQSIVPAPVDSEMQDPPEINNDVDQSSIAAVRWV